MLPRGVEIVLGQPKIYQIHLIRVRVAYADILELQVVVDVVQLVELPQSLDLDTRMK